MNKTVKAIFLFFTMLVYTALTWIIFKPPLSFSYHSVWIWLISIFLLLGVGFRLITNKFYGNFFVSYIMFGVAGIISVLFLGANVLSMATFNKEGYENLAQITIADAEKYEMTAKDVLFIPSEVAKRKAVKELATYLSEDEGFILSDGYLQKVGDDFLYVYSIDHENKESKSPGFAMLNARTGEFRYKKVNTPMSYSPYRKDSQNIIKMIKKQNGNIPVSDAHLEIDDKMNPVWVVYGYGPAVSTLGGKTTKEVYICNPFTGDISTLEKINVPEWIDYKSSLELIPSVFNKAVKTAGIQGKMKTDPLILPRNNKLYAMYNLTKGKVNTGVAFVELDTGATKVYSIDTVGSDRILECLLEWQSAEQGHTHNIPILSVLDGRPIFTFPMFDKSASLESYLFIDGKEGSYYASGEDWESTKAEFMENYNKPPEPELEPKPSKKPILDDGKGEGTLYSLINGMVQSINEDGDNYIVVIYPWKTKFYITKDLISKEELEKGKTKAITLQYPMEYSGKEIVYDCVPIPNVEVVTN